MEIADPPDSLLFPQMCSGFGWGEGTQQDVNEHFALPTGDANEMR